MKQVDPGNLLIQDSGCRNVASNEHKIVSIYVWEYCTLNNPVIILKNSLNMLKSKDFNGDVMLQIWV